MPATLRLVPYTAKDIISTLKVLLSMAVNGKLRGLAVCYRTDDGQEHHVVAGLYRIRPNDPRI
jgi:hypothetical protein